ncbi:unnamed protein product [Candidula unifasciata]|uniref:Ribosomal protein eL8/eL30/eS12/Gadd45 domain-containing protein n=1 Tax=Candidula unifasciata TaxID=100452 RepID=A0A8S3ZM31_9EUPU|nr:unnamed protein product [Candidula unifasciata]
MAAPTIPASRRKANLSTMSLKEKTPKVTRKNILCPVSQEWPRVTKEVEGSILMKLTEKLTGGVNIVKHVKKSAVDDKSEKARIRSQLEVGTSGVFRALERDELACVLISGQATPAITVDHIISLAQDQGCPLLCLDQLAPTVAKATQSKCLPLALGFKKIDNSHSEFAEVISLVQSNTTTCAPQKIVNLSAAQPVAGQGSTQTLYQGLKLKDNTDKEKHDSKKKKRRKKQKLKDLFERAFIQQFDIGKRTVAAFLERGKYEVVLVSEQVTPVLLADTKPVSLLSVAAVKKCPVVVLPGLVDALKALFGATFSVLALKKLSSFQDEQKHFKPIIDKCLQAVTNTNEQQLPERQESTGSFSTTKSEPSRKPHELCPEEEVVAISMDTETADLQASQNIEFTSDQKRVPGKESAVISANNEVSDEDAEIEDYSYLYVMKAESKELADAKNELKAFTSSLGNDPFSADYISLSTTSSESRVQSSSSSGKQKGHLSKKQKLTPAQADKTASLASSKPKTVSLNSSTVSKQPDLSEQRKDNFIPFTEAGTSSSQNLFREAESLDIDTRIKTSSKEMSAEVPLFTICRSGNSVPPGSAVESTQHKLMDDVDKLISNKEDGTVNDTPQEFETPLFFLCKSNKTTSQSSSIEPVQQKQQDKEDKSGASLEDEIERMKASSQLQTETPFFNLSGNPVSPSSPVEPVQQKHENKAKLTTSSKEDKIVKVKELTQDQNETPFFSLCRSGNPVSQGTKKSSQQKRPNNDNQLVNINEDNATLGAHELRASTADTKYKGIDFLSLVEPSKDARKAVKRKLQGEQSYISFAYTESNIQTMVSNPSKKKKKKKKQKK